MIVASAGILLYRDPPEPAVFLAHPGGPFWKHRDQGAWTIPKGIIEPGEDPLEAAQREFFEETGSPAQPPFVCLGTIRQKAGKTVHAWASEGQINPRSAFSNHLELEVPRGSGKFITVPEIDRYGWFSFAEASAKINPAQIPFLERLRAQLAVEIGLPGLEPRTNKL